MSKKVGEKIEAEYEIKFEKAVEDVWLPFVRLIQEQSAVPHISETEIWLRKDCIFWYDILRWEMRMWVGSAGSKGKIEKSPILR